MVMSMAKRGGVEAKHYVLHISHVNGKTVCGKDASKVNCFADIRADDAAIQEVCCKRCSAAVKSPGSAYAADLAARH